jgi:hypothetical protein
MRPARRVANAKAVAMLGALCAALITTALAAETSIPLINPGFESHKPGARGNPEGWVSIQHAGDLSYTFDIDDAIAHGGARSVRIDNVGPEPFGALFQQVAAGPHRGRRVRLSAWMRTHEARGSATGGGAVLLLQAMQAGAPLAWNHMKDAPVRGSTDWQRYAIEIDVPAAADQIELGTMLHGPGAMWLDDVMLEIVADRS